MASDFSAKVIEACEAGEKFVEAFYDIVDKRRTLLAGMYSETSFMVWDGNTNSGSAGISGFYQSLPGSEHVITAFDCQPVNKGDDETTVLVCSEGQVTYDRQGTKNFSQSFLLVKQGDFWKISSDCFRFTQL